MADEPSWDDIFASQPSPSRDDDAARRAQRPDAADGQAPRPQTPDAAPAAPTESVPLSRRALREQQAAEPEPETRRSRRSGTATLDTPPAPTARERRRQREDDEDRVPLRKRLGCLWVLLALIVLLGGTAAAVYATFGDRIRDAIGASEPNDYEGSGNGTEVLVTIVSGDIGEDVATTLHEEGVTKTFDAFYDLLLGMSEQPNFVPGTYALQQEMSAKSALDALLDPANRRVSQAVIREGITVTTILQELSDATGTPLAEFEAVAADFRSLGVPAEAPSLEGYLAPATYEFEPGTAPRDMMQQMVNLTIQRLDAAGVAPPDRNRIMTIASLAQREAGNQEDLYKVARVIYNRLDEGMKLQFDSTSHYGAQSTGSVFTTNEERAAVNPYNTYVIDGLPVGPIAAPGEAAINAALNPEPGDWLYFVAVNLATGESEFTRTQAEHEAAVEKLDQWCREPENASYCE
ncbi:UPF0755 protein [Diaminobutyricimonas aerilata]|uniref:Endolytic murein transglycosylase n=1 Tax=Diaminobutyricimonas aerilata TaxID=1162967 RepID=A0A2M9CK92_9MICO|nr:endolytic transglycosylase MltG [Diaminobutyricimonas aerilata]PJJ72304.1 UPF0755 protein [Diaminobutyricimonas aerilata]